MRIWDIPPERLCFKHLVAEHGELHSLWSVLTNKKKGFSKHPETLRWKGKLKALFLRHEALVKEMKKRGYQHRSPLNKKQAKGKSRQFVYLQTPQEQERILKNKNCDCLRKVIFVKVGQTK